MSKAAHWIALARGELGSPYVYGAWGGPCTPDYRLQYAGYNPGYRAAIVESCPVLSGGAASCQGCPFEGKRAYDCRGFTRWTLYQIGLTLQGGGATGQYDTAANWAFRGTVPGMPDRPCCVFKRRDGKMTHTGLYAGGGRVIHCSGQVKESALDTSWTHFAVPAGLYTDEEIGGVKMEKPVLLRGASGDAVRTLQQLLNRAGHSLTVDGIFGAKTEAAVKACQKSRGLAADGVVTAALWTALEAGAEDSLSAVRDSLANCLARLNALMEAGHA